MTQKSLENLRAALPITTARMTGNDVLYLPLWRIMDMDIVETVLWSKRDNETDAETSEKLLEKIEEQEKLLI